MTFTSSEQSALAGDQTEGVEALHALVAGEEVDVTPVQRIADMEVPGRVGRRGIDDELRLFRVLVKIMVLVAPGLSPALLHFGEIIVFRQLIR